MKFIKTILFAHVALALLVLGAFAAHYLWEATHHRYDDPATGFYYASVNAKFDSLTDDDFFFFFRGQSRPQWHWRYTTNFFYDVLELEWQRFGEHDSKDASGRATLHLESLALSGTETGTLTEGVLANWLLGTTNASPAALQKVTTIYNYVLAAGDGSLPAPNHHGHRYEQPVRGSIHHFRLGIGIGSYVYIWVYLWTLGVAVGSYMDRKGRHTNLPAAKKHVDKDNPHHQIGIHVNTC